MRKPRDEPFAIDVLFECFTCKIRRELRMVENAVELRSEFIEHQDLSHEVMFSSAPYFWEMQGKGDKAVPKLYGGL
jgi:hypothetical protein